MLGKWRSSRARRLLPGLMTSPAVGARPPPNRRIQVQKRANGRANLPPLLLPNTYLEPPSSTRSATRMSAPACYKII
ncbi:unnamed protein product [Nesidiocoris tenuis]|uniref:Uncharacterized protein n=1 Tax=Nesidiocoris tenuis TaxID=355587 RepID=A0A6H5GQ73_9HEMI|nr:unnamed protein product [Nesidiocoris tenuis]